jgi:hypothetical protein
MLGFGYLVVTTDWRALACFDGTEPGCWEPAQDYGLSAVPPGSWLLTLAAVMAALGAFVVGSP